MIGFLYVVGIVIHFLIVAYIDAKGSEFFNITARKDTYFKGDRNVDVGMALAGGLLWPVLLICVIVGAAYRGILRLLMREPKRVKEWRCPEFTAASYRAATPCSKRLKSDKQPTCALHNVEMMES